MIVLCPGCNQPIYVGFDGATECGGEGDGVCDAAGTDPCPPDVAAAHLRARLAAPILDDAGARQHLALLVRRGWTYSPDESAADATDEHGAPMFDADTAALLDARMGEVYAHLGDPCAVLLALAGIDAGGDEEFSSDTNKRLDGY